MSTASNVPGTVDPQFEPVRDGWVLSATAGPVPAGTAGRVVRATVPGCAHTDLLDAGLIADPYLDTNENELVWAHRTDWQYATAFGAPKADDRERVDLVMRASTLSRPCASTVRSWHRPPTSTVPTAQTSVSCWWTAGTP